MWFRFLEPKPQTRSASGSVGIVHIDIFDIHAKGFGNPLSIGGIGQIAVTDMALLDNESRSLHVPAGILKQPLSLVRLHHPEQLAGLFVVMIIVFPKVVVVDRPLAIQGRFLQIVLILPHAIGIRIVVHGAVEVSIDAHRSIPMIVVGLHPAAVDGDLVVVDP